MKPLSEVPAGTGDLVDWEVTDTSAFFRQITRRDAIAAVAVAVADWPAFDPAPPAICLVTFVDTIVE